MQTKPHDEKPCTVAEAAILLGVSPFTIRSWIARRRLGHLKLSRAVRIPRAEVARLLNDSYTPPMPEHH
jgi:excisionase family DNA binding protein